jgi:hypothetical protein
LKKNGKSDCETMAYSAWLVANENSKLSGLSGEPYTPDRAFLKHCESAKKAQKTTGGKPHWGPAFVEWIFQRYAAPPFDNCGTALACKTLRWHREADVPNSVQEFGRSRMTLDLLVKNGTVVDGSGGPRYRADLGVKGGKIVEIGRVRAVAEQTIDADGLIVAPVKLPRRFLGSTHGSLGLVRSCRPAHHPAMWDFDFEHMNFLGQLGSGVTLIPVAEVR